MKTVKQYVNDICGDDVLVPTDSTPVLEECAEDYGMTIAVFGIVAALTGGFMYLFGSNLLT